MPSVDDGNRGVLSAAEIQQNINETNRVINRNNNNNNVVRANDSVGGQNYGSGLYTNNGTTQSPTGAYYPSGTYRGNQLPTSGVGMLLGALNPMGSMLGMAGKTLWNQTKFGMNDAVKVHYDKLVKDGMPTNMSVEEVVQQAREMYHTDNDKAGTPTRGTDNSLDAIGATHTVNADSGAVVEDTEETAAAEMGKLGLTNVTGPDGRPSWAPSLPDANAVDPYAPKAAPADGLPAYDQYAPTWGDATTPVDDGGNVRHRYGNWGGGKDDGDFGNWLDGEKRLYDDGEAGYLPYETGPRGMLLNGSPQAAQMPQYAQAPQIQQTQGTPAYESLQNMITGNQAPVAQAMQVGTQAPQVSGGAAIPSGATATDSGTFRPVTFRSGTGTATTDAAGTTTALNDPYSGLSSLVGSGQGLLSQAAVNAQQAPDQLNFDMNNDQRAQDLFAQRSALLEPAFAQQRALAKQDMFGSGRLGLRLSGEAVGAGSGMIQPEAFGMNQAQSQALAGLASQSTDDAFAQSQAMAGLESQRFSQNQQAQQQQYANLMGSGQGMLSAGLQGAQLEGAIAQQQAANQQNQYAQGMSQARLALDTQAQAQNFGLASQGQSQDYGLNAAQFNLASQGQQQNFGLAQQTQDQNYGLNQQRFALDERGQQQNFGLASRSQDLAELSNSQNFGLANQRMAFDNRGQQQNFGLAQQQQDQNYGLQQQQQMQDYGQNQQNFGLAQQQQRQDYGLSQQQMGLATQQQLQDYEMGMLTGNRNYNLQRDVAAQNYELATEGNRIGLITGQARANKDNYQPNDWLNLVGGGLNAYAGTVGGSAAIGGFLKGLF